MSIRVQLVRDAADAEVVEREFGFRWVLHEIDTRPSRKFALSRLCAFAAHPDPEADPELAAAMVASPGVAGRLREIAAAVGLPEAIPAAAHSGTGLRERRGPGWRIELLTSRAPQETYVVIEVEGVEQPHALLLFDTKSGCYLPPVMLPAFHGKQAQMLVAEGSETLDALRSPFVAVKLM